MRRIIKFRRYFESIADTRLSPGMFQDNLRRFSNMKRRLRLTFEVKS
jgi:hypothetical protein